jgi:hypothetical protein
MHTQRRGDQRAFRHASGRRFIVLLYTCLIFILLYSVLVLILLYMGAGERLYRDSMHCGGGASGGSGLALRRSLHQAQLPLRRSLDVATTRHPSMPPPPAQCMRQPLQETGELNACETVSRQFNLESRSLTSQVYGEAIDGPEAAAPSLSHRQ